MIIVKNYKASKVYMLDPHRRREVIQRIVTILLGTKIRLVIHADMPIMNPIAFISCATGVR